MSTRRIQAIPVEILLFEDVLAPVTHWTFNQIPEMHLLARRESRRQHGCGDEIENGGLYVWTPRKKERQGLFNTYGRARPRRLLGKDSTTQPALRRVDADEIRDRFFQVKNAEQGLCLFREYGIFGEEQRNIFQFVAGLSFADLQVWQELLGACRLTDPSDWEALCGQYAHLRQASDILQVPEFSIDIEPHPAFRLRCEGVRDVILAAIYLDKLDNVRSSMCQRNDCGVVFNHESRHVRRFCSPECAHHEAVRRNRARKAGQ
jgi:hypothetical protein